MAVLKNFEDDELVISCITGDGMHIKIDRSLEEYDYYAFLIFSSANFYTEQDGLLKKLKKIWAIIRNKDFYYSEICMNKKDFKRFAEWINKNAEFDDDDLIQNAITALDKVKEKYPNIKIIIDACNGSASAKLSDANIYNDPANNIVIDAE